MDKGSPFSKEPGDINSKVSPLLFLSKKLAPPQNGKCIIAFFKGMPMKKLVSEPFRCVNCRICEMACSLAKAGLFSPAKARIWIHHDQEGAAIPMICRHCKSSACQKACPVGSISMNDKDIVILDAEGCIRCYQCVTACPFSALKVDCFTGDAIKCDTCDGDPECVKWCPSGAIIFT